MIIHGKEDPKLTEREVGKLCKAFMEIWEELFPPSKSGLLKALGR